MLDFVTQAHEVKRSLGAMHTIVGMLLVVPRQSSTGVSPGSSHHCSATWRNMHDAAIYMHKHVKEG